MEYDFNIIENPRGETPKKYSFTIDEYGGIYKPKGSGRNYLLSNDECRLVIKAGGVNKIWLFLKNSYYKDVLTVGGLNIINLNP